MLSDLNPSFFEIVLAVLTVLGAGKILELLIVRFLGRKTDVVINEKLKAEVVALELTNRQSEVETVRAVLDEVKEHSATKDKRIDNLETTVISLSARLERMEEREHQTHQLTAAHEAWDLQIYQRMLMHDADFPQPPPLRAPLLVEVINTQTVTTEDTSSQSYTNGAPS